jgi:hypothetical protein
VDGRKNRNVTFFLSISILGGRFSFSANNYFQYFRYPDQAERGVLVSRREMLCIKGFIKHINGEK